MSDQTDAVTETTTDAEPQHDAATDEPLGEPGKKALEAERNARKAAEKAAAEYAAKLKDIEAAQMSDLERAQATAREAQEAAAKATAEALRWRVASEYGIKREDAEVFLTGGDEESLTRQAERLATLATPGPTTPKPDLSQGAKGAAPVTTAQQFAAAMEGQFTS